MRIAACVLACLWVAAIGLTQSAPKRQYVVILKRGPRWIEGKPVAEQPVGNHGRYLQAQMEKGVLQFAGPFLDDSGGLIVYNAGSEAEAREIEAKDPGVASQVLAVEAVRPFLTAFDAGRGISPFK